MPQRCEELQLAKRIHGGLQVNLGHSGGGVPQAFGVEAEDNPHATHAMKFSL
jgi:hypothetical protein